MQSHIKYYIFVCVFLSIISTGFSGIKCWECQSITDPKCADPFDNSTLFITDCSHVRGLSDLPSICRKIRQNVNGVWHYIRDCASLDEFPNRGEKPVCFTRTTTDNTIQEHCTCSNKDGCNSSFTCKPSSLLLTSVLLFLVKMF